MSPYYQSLIFFLIFITTVFILFVYDDMIRRYYKYKYEFYNCCSQEELLKVKCENCLLKHKIETLERKVKYYDSL